MSPQPTLYQLEPGSRRDELTVRQVWAQDGPAPLAAGYRHLLALDDVTDTRGGDDRRDRDHLRLVSVDEAGKASAFHFTPAEPWITPVDADLDLTRQWDVLRPFVIGDVPHLLAYTTEDGQFAFFPITSELRALPPYLFARKREPGPTAGFDTVEPIVVGGLVHYMCYSEESGRVVIYALEVTARGPDGMPPLRSHAVWVHEWAARWTRFAFFQLGTGTYFLKTNEGRLNVNIDHVLDDPSQGAVEVAGHLDLSDALDLDIVRPFTLPDGNPAFLTYMDDGRTTFNRFHGDGRGWTTEATLTTVPDATHIVPLVVDSRRYVLFY